MSVSIFDHLQEIYPDQKTISRADLRAFLGISIATDARMKRDGDYPRTIHVRNSELILLIDFAAWLEAGSKIDQKPRRGRPKGSRNKPKATQSPLRTAPQLPPEMAALIY